MIWFHEILKLIFQMQPSCLWNICTEHWKNYLTWQLSWKFFIPEEQRFCRAYVKSFVYWAIHLFLRQNKVFTLYLVDLVVLNFYFDLVPPFYFLKWNRYFSACKWKLYCIVLYLFAIYRKNVVTYIQVC